MINNVATGSVITKQFEKERSNFVFRNAAPDNIQAPMIVDQAIGRMGMKKPAILADSTNYGQLGREDLEKALAPRASSPSPSRSSTSATPT